MRQQPLLAAMVGLLAAALPAFGQAPTYPADAVILLNEVEVRSGPSKTFFPTSKLNRNDKVYVLRESKEAPGWLEIRPPTGSFSWINAKNARQVDQRTAYVEGEPSRPVSILPGSTLVNQEPNRVSMTLTAGTIVVIVDRPMNVGGETWLPIQPHPSEVRFIPAEAVKTTPVIATNNSPPNWNRTPDGFAANSVLAQAQDAEKANDMNRARWLYQQVANNSMNPSEKQFAVNRLASLQNPVQAQATSNSGYSPSTPPPGPAMTNLQQLQPPGWSTYGRLRDTKMTREDGQPIYSLEDNAGRVVSYVTTNPGKSLQTYIGRTVAVYGPRMWRPDSAVRLEYIVATHVAQP
jgi:uncharacterized protein YgiM (DUF1202 family)